MLETTNKTMKRELLLTLTYILLSKYPFVVDVSAQPSPTYSTPTRHGSLGGLEQDTLPTVTTSAYAKKGKPDREQDFSYLSPPVTGRPGSDVVTSTTIQAPPSTAVRTTTSTTAATQEGSTTTTTTVTSTEGATGISTTEATTTDQSSVVTTPTNQGLVAVEVSVTTPTNGADSDSTTGSTTNDMMSSASSSSSTIQQFPTSPQSQVVVPRWNLRTFTVTTTPNSAMSEQVLTEALYLGLELFTKDRFGSAVVDLELFVTAIAENMYEYSGSVQFDETSSTIVVHEVQVWQAQTDFLETWLVDQRGVVARIVLETGQVVGREPVSTDVQDGDAVEQSQEAPEEVSAQQRHDVSASRAIISVTTCLTALFAMHGLIYSLGL